MDTQHIDTFPSLPPYTEMIIAAIDGLNEEMGSNKTSILKYIESKYHNLPTGHTTLLRHHLSRMKDTGKLIFWKNNYMKPNPNFIRRGRGRPRKEPGTGASYSPKSKAQPRNDEHFRYTFVNEQVRRSARYYSPRWRTWAVVAIQLAWRRYKNRLTLDSLWFIQPRRPLSRSCSLSEYRLRLYSALLTSPKPKQDDLDQF